MAKHILQALQQCSLVLEVKEEISNIYTVVKSWLQPSQDWLDWQINFRLTANAWCIRLACILHDPPLFSVKWLLFHEHICSSSTPPPANTPNRAFTQHSHTSSCMTAVGFVWLWWMRQAVQRSGTNTVNTFPTRQGSCLSWRGHPQLSRLTESFGAMVLTATDPGRGRHGGDVHFKEDVAVFICVCAQAKEQRQERKHNILYLWDFSFVHVCACRGGLCNFPVYVHAFLQKSVWVCGR